MKYLELKPGINILKTEVIGVEAIDEMTCKVLTSIGAYDCIYPSWRILMLLGLDPLYVANEGKLIVICDPQVAQIVLRTMRAHPLGLNAQQIGVVVEDSNNFVCMTTKLGGQRMIDWLNAEQLPRIC